MKNNFFLFIIFFTALISCDNGVQKYDAKVYENASKHLPQNLNKYVKNNLTSQKWIDNNLYFNVKSDNTIKSYKIDAESLEIIEEELPDETRPSVNYLEIVSPNKKKSIYIKNYNLWIRDLTTKKTKQLTFNGYEDYGYATNNAGWIKNDRPVLKWSNDSKIITTF